MTLARLLLVLSLCLLGGIAARAQEGAVPLTVDGAGFTIHDFRSGAVAFGNRSYVWQSVPTAFSGWKFTQTDGGAHAQITVHGTQDGYLYIAAGEPVTLGQAWEKLATAPFSYTDRNRTALTLYRTPYKAGTSVPVPQSGWTGTLVLAPALSLGTTPPVTPPPGVVIDYLPAEDRQFVGSPTIAVLPDGSYVAAHDFFGSSEGDRMRVFRSTDRGATWQPVADLTGQYWSSLFVHRGALYLIGTSRGFGSIVIRRSTDGGCTWTTPRDAASGLLRPGRGYHCAPTPVLESNGRLWRAFEFNPPGAKGRQFQALVLSAPVDADLLRADNWISTNPLPYAIRETGGNWLEGNAVAAPDGSIADVLRISKDGLEKAALLHVSPDGRRIGWEPARDRIDLPGGGVKFTIRYDFFSRRYWSLVNKQRNPNALRNVLSLVSSPDLRNWRVEATLLQHPDPQKHAFQYVDWLFDGDDIIAVSRTSWDGDTYHNANYLTFHRFRNFRTSPRER